MEKRDVDNVFNGIKTFLDGVSGILKTIDKTQKGEKIEAADEAIDTTEKFLENLRRFK